MSLKLVISNLWKGYGDKTVLKDLSYVFDEKKVYVVMGPNGSGKTTFLKICALLETPDKGEIYYYDSNNKILPKDINLLRKITYVFPEVGIFNTSVFDNVAYGLKIRGFNKKEINSKVEEVLDFVGLSHKKKQNALTLSSGEAKRMGLARAMVIKPEFLFLDEPTAFVDTENTKLIERLLIKIKDQKTTTIVIATHDSPFAFTVGDEIVKLENGKIFEVS
ncbi:MAG TPA: ABC transporter ATP-binding protein [Thermodesulfobacterium commune]|uniref:ABC transporter ATP-binding protein n=1 Tax=Thermodesulfobacterium commune TaxID=1741 RepID=A0A101FII8_9BACT|nr:MAG: ATPase component of tungstate ABC transporter [Thermodesulfobacterium commune]HAA83861.1 ABC transporter ATP-binding protein [Thermodesulfobacterium commune]HBT03403.1 ABC transporter ATP-binding protein [Thermodesulfobacterium commune]HCE79793.1 ABC transporter ATP-binding protein [Thermodesulfobacterium commune]HCP09312.1 ABC transporter ATP-binding protein [Thermodesulfobacterium commune]